MNDLACAAPTAAGAGLREVFEAARGTCLNGHQAGCTYGGMSIYTGYWLAVDDCLQRHSECAWCGGEATAAFVGREPDDRIWGVQACQSCATSYVAANPRFAHDSAQEQQEHTAVACAAAAAAMRDELRFERPPETAGERFSALIAELGMFSSALLPPVDRGMLAGTTPAVHTFTGLLGPIEAGQYQGPEPSVVWVDECPSWMPPYTLTHVLPTTQVTLDLPPAPSAVEDLRLLERGDDTDEFMRAATSVARPGVGRARAESLVDCVLALASGEPPESIIERDQRIRRVFAPFDPDAIGYRWSIGGGRRSGKTAALEAARGRWVP